MKSKIAILSLAAFNALYTAGNPWAPIKDTVRTGIFNFVTDFMVPIVSVVLVIIGLLQIPGVVSEHQNGHGNDFWKKIMVMAGCIIAGLAMGAIWTLLRAQI